MEHFITILRWLVAVGFVTVGVFLYLTARLGRGCARTDPDPLGRCLTEHEWNAKVTCWITLAVVVITETFVRLNGGSGGSTLFWWHISFAAPFLTCLWYVAFRHTGIRRPKTHRYFAYTVVVLYVGTLFTGLSLLFPGFAEVILVTFKFFGLVFWFVIKMMWDVLSELIH